LNDRAVDLASRAARVNNQPHVLHGDEFVHFHDAGFEIDRNMRHLHTADARARKHGWLAALEA